MSSTVMELRRTSGHSIHSAAEHIVNEFNCRMVSPDVVLHQEDTLGTGQVILLVLERYYIRNGSYANLTIQLTDDGQWQKATVIGSGGGEGIFNISWGANSSFATDAVDMLRKIGFQ